MREKERVTVSIDAELAEQARRAVVEGRATSVSGWVSQAIRRQAEHDARMSSLDALIADFETEHGEITAEEMAGAKRRAASRATIARGAA